MNRMDRKRLDDRRRKLNSPSQNQSDLNTSGSSKSLMDNYFQSQKVIQSLSDNPNPANEAKTKSFKIPKKQPVNTEARRYNGDRHRDLDVRNQYNNKWSNDRRNPRDTQQNGDFRGRYSNNSKPFRLETNSRRDRFVRRKPEVNTNNSTTDLEKIHLKNRLYFNQPVEVIIADRAAPSGKISPENAAIFLNEIKESVVQRISTNPTYQTKFIDQRHENGLITMTCADDFTSVFIQQKVTENHSLWPGAKLEWSFGNFKNCFIRLVVPNSIGHISEFLHKCKKTDSRMLIEKWRRIECEDTDDESGKLFKLAIDKQSYEVMKQQGNVVRCGSLSIKIELDALNEISEEGK